MPSEYQATKKRRRGNPNWGKPEPSGPVIPTITEFEQVLKELHLTYNKTTTSINKCLKSEKLKEWARKNTNSHYIPEVLLDRWGFIPTDAE